MLLRRISAPDFTPLYVTQTQTQTQAQTQTQTQTWLIHVK